MEKKAAKSVTNLSIVAAHPKEFAVATRVYSLWWIQRRTPKARRFALARAQKTCCTIPGTAHIPDNQQTRLLNCVGTYPFQNITKIGLVWNTQILSVPIPDVGDIQWLENISPEQ